MHILMLAPQPFFERRGTPIAVRHLLETLGALGHDVDLLTLHLGQPAGLQRVKHWRTPWLPIRRVAPGFSYKKIFLDGLLALRALDAVATRRYDVIHCVEEAVWIGLLLRPLHRRPCVYDMDSSIPEQLADRGGLWRTMRPLCEQLEAWAIRRSLCAITVCRALTERVLKASPRKPVFQIEDPPLLPESGGVEGGARALRRQLEIKDESLVVLYLGNLSPYQGVSLLLEAFAKTRGGERNARLVVVGGQREDVARAEQTARSVGIAPATVFVGEVTPEASADYLKMADVLVSPRLRGTNTPMKLYTYMAAGKAIVATDLFTHTQVLDEESAVLVPPTPEGMAAGLRKVLGDAALRARLGQRAKALVDDRYSIERYRAKVRAAFSWIEEAVAKEKSLQV